MQKSYAPVCNLNAVWDFYIGLSVVNYWTILYSQFQEALRVQYFIYESPRVFAESQLYDMSNK